MRFPLIYQRDTTDCGPAALAMMAAHHHKRISIARLRELAGTDKHGTTLTGLITAAETIGFTAKAVRGTTVALADVPIPAIVHWREDERNHFVVLVEINEKKAYLADP